jgi:ribosomal-protein-alanine N-acetyltransferase
MRPVSHYSACWGLAHIGKAKRDQQALPSRPAESRRSRRRRRLAVIVEDVTGFVTTRLVATPISLEDAPFFERLWGDEQVGRTLGGVRGTGAVRRDLAGSVDHWQVHGFGRWVLWLGREPVGSVKLAVCEVAGQREVELGYALLPDYWGNGYATEAATGALNVAKHPLELDEVVAFALTSNTRSLAVTRRLGFAHEQDIELPGGPHSLCRLRLSHP